MSNLNLFFRSTLTLFKKSSSNSIISDSALVQTTERIKRIEVNSPYEFDSNGNLTTPFRPFINQTNL